MGIKKVVKIIEEIFDPKEHVTPRVQRMRLNDCMGCEKRIPITNQCSLCLCFMSLKTKLKSKYCELRTAEFPNGKWQKVD